ncbi:autotransporter domain-containing protein [Alcaligenes endophyticus]|uniref:Autotransporter domain-containing protein n=1 Tax=Alcaligenes endophyticus TaxID=1929088 RepID=A0ABT8EJS2_9BURK|nr:autotransporter domain-containing protein [Alcaligenes endophyticus]MCX5591853.1 autotransporter domain-containing protein [Alcaligenes endophyticus]MDN4121543.1 autotransporter domain-containing protein [Alcaligenes endophyticus]
MNKIHKVIWSHSKSAFVVVSDLVGARSRSGARSERSATPPQETVRQTQYTITALAASILLVFGVSTPVAAQIVLDYGLGDEYVSAQIGDWGNALTIKNDGAGVGSTTVRNGTFKVLPGVNPRPNSDPYAAVMVEAGTDEQDWAYVQDGVIAVEGENLHGVYVQSGARASVGDTSIAATGDGVSGVTVQGGPSNGSFNLSGTTVDVSGSQAAGLKLNSGGNHITGGSVIKVAGENAIGVDVDGGELYFISPGADRNEIAVTGVAGSDATGIRFTSGSGYTLQGGALMNFDIDVQGDPLGRSSTGINIEGATLFADGKRHMYLGNSTAGDEAHKRITITVQGGTDTQSEAVGINTSSDISVDLRNAALSVEGQKATGIQVDAESNLNVSDNVSIAVTGYDVYGINLMGDNQLTLEQGTTIDVAGTGEWASGVRSWLGGDLSLSGVTLNVESTGPVYTFGTAQGVEVRESNVNISDGSQISVASEYLAYGISSLESDVTLSNVTVSAVSDQTARTLFFEQDLVSIDSSDFKAKGKDSRVLTAQQSTVDVTRAIIAAEDANWATGVYASDSTMTLSEVNIDVKAALVATGIVADSGSELKLSDSTVEVTGDGGSTSGISSSTSSVTVENTDLTVNGLGTGWSSNNDTHARIVDSQISIIADGSVAAVNIGGSQDVVIQGSSTTLSARSNEVESLATALQVNNGASVQVESASLEATVLDDRSYAVGLSAGAGSAVSLLNAQLVVDAGQGEALGAGAGNVGSEITLGNTTVMVTGEARATGLSFLDSAIGQVADSLIQVEGKKGATGVSALEGSVTLNSSRVEVSAEQQALGVLAADSVVTLDGVNVKVDGGDGTYALAAAFGGTLNTSGGTTLESSGGGVVLESDVEGAQVALTHTKIISGGPTLTAFQGDVGVMRMDLGAGVVATENNGALLLVERDTSIQTGRVELTISDGATVSGSITDDAGSLTDLTATGGTFVALNQAQYAGAVQNVRGIELSNGSTLSGGSFAAPNTVLEDVQIDQSTLAGNWNIGGTLHALNGARVAPGNSIGVITTNAINWGNGTVYEVEVNAAGEADRVDVTGPGAADISQTALHVMQENGNGGYRLDHDYTILTAAGGIAGEFTEASWQGNELIIIKPSYQANLVTMALAVNNQALQQANLTANQRATSDGALSVAGLNAAVDAAFLSVKPSAAFDQLSGEIHPSTRVALMSNSTWLSNAILGRLGDHSAGSAPLTDSGYPLWLSYTHGDQKTKGDSNTAERKNKTNSIALGAEALLESDWRVGGAFAYTDSKVKLNARDSSADIDSYSLALYAGKSWLYHSNSLNLKAGVAHIWHDIDSRRHVELGGQQSLKASYDARTTQLFGELGYSMAVSDRSMVEPYLGLTWLSHRSDGFSESGGAAALKGKSHTDDVTLSTVGVRAATSVDMGTTAVKLRGGLGWRHAFGDRQPKASLSFIQGNSSTFGVVGAPMIKNAAVFDLGAEVQVGRNTSIGLSYEGQAGSGFTEHTGNLSLRTRF